ncbi:MAG: hypothetical protein IKT93_02045 [Clostridia bacterium]|nr:hypothetical protein [Clostridia bacterium]
MDKFLNKENIVIVVAVITILVQSNYFATKLDLANIKLEMAEMNQELKSYIDKNDKELMVSIESKLQNISDKIDRIHR